MSRNTSSDARLVSKTLGRTFSVQPLVSTVLRSTWALWPIVRIAVLSKRASRSLAQTGWGFRRGETLDSGTLKCPILDPILELILDPILGPSWSQFWPHLGAPEAWKHLQKPMIFNTFQSFRQYQHYGNGHFASTKRPFPDPRGLSSRTWIL